MNKIVIDQLINEMITILVTEVNTVKDKSNLIFTHKVDPYVGRLLKKAIGKYSLDWATDIIRDEVYASLYEAMIKISEDYSAEEITLENNEFCSRVHGLAELLIKKELIVASTKNRDGEIMATNEEPVDPQEDEETGRNKLEDLLNKQYTEEDTKMNHFLRWFHDNKSKVLTKKQQQFINNELLDMDRRNTSKMKQRIADRVIKAYNDKYSTLTERQAELIDTKHIIESILDANNFRTTYNEYIDNDYIIDAIIDNVSFETMKAFNNGSDNKQVIKEYRVALFKALAKVNSRLEAEGLLDLF